MQTLYVEHKSSSYVIQEPGGVVFRMNRDGTQTRIFDQRHTSKILTRHRVITEAEALIMAYAHPAQEQTHNAALALNAGPQKPSPADPRRLYNTKILLFFAAAKGGLATLLEFFLLLMALPALAFGLTFVFVAGFLIYLFIHWIIVKLNRHGSP
jgi:hypothetical protein